MKELLYELLMEDKTLIHVPFGDGFFCSLQKFYSVIVISIIGITIAGMLFSTIPMCFLCLAIVSPYPSSLPE